MKEIQMKMYIIQVLVRFKKTYFNALINWSYQDVGNCYLFKNALLKDLQKWKLFHLTWSYINY